jgi:metal-responsive CopG/Arc/MetJ family transcriptional regulator
MGVASDGERAVPRGGVEVYGKMIPTSFKIEPETLEELDQAAKTLKMERSVLIRKAIRWYLFHIKNSQKPTETKRMKIYTVP